MTAIKKQYEIDFQGEDYIQDFIVNDEIEHKWFVEDFYHHLFSQGKLYGKTLIDVGCGPTNRAAAIASRYGCEVYCADLLESNRNIVQSWLKNGHGAFDLTALFKYVARLEDQNDIEYLEERAKKSIREVIFCDILADNPLHPLPFQQFDIVTSSLCLDCYPDEQDYLRGAKGIASLVRPGGHLAFTSSLGATQYKVGGKKFPSANVDCSKAKRALIQAGLKVLEVGEYYFNRTKPLITNEKGFLTIYAKKL